MKRCKGECGINKLLTAFNKDKSRKDGYHPYCKDCRKGINKSHYDFKHPTSANVCIDCDTDISNLHFNCIRCKECKVIDLRECKKLSRRKAVAANPIKYRVIGKLWRKKKFNENLIKI